MARQPARTPLPRPMQLHRVEPHLDAMRPGMFGNPAIGGTHGEVRWAAEPFPKGFPRETPRLVLRVLDLARPQPRPPTHPAARATPSLYKIASAMDLTL